MKDIILAIVGFTIALCGGVYLADLLFLKKRGITALAEVTAVNETKHRTIVFFSYIVKTARKTDSYVHTLRYEIDGEVTKDFPTTVKLAKAKPVWKVLPGWNCDIRGIREYDKLPENCRKYIEFIESEIGFPITMVSNGPGREEIIYRESALK